MNATANCGGVGKVINCGYQTTFTASHLVNVFVLHVGSNLNRSTCGATLIRTAESGSKAGATIQAAAICRV